MKFHLRVLRTTLVFLILIALALGLSIGALILLDKHPGFILGVGGLPAAWILAYNHEKKDRKNEDHLS